MLSFVRAAALTALVISAPSLPAGPAWASSVTSTTLALSVASATYGHEQTVRASVGLSPGASGTVRIQAGTATVCTLTVLDATASCLLPAKAVAAGAYSLTAAYAGSATQAPSRSIGRPLSVAKSPTRTVVSVAHANVKYGGENAEKFSVVVTPSYAAPATGKVTITTGRTRLCTVTLVAGKGSCAMARTKLIVGTFIVKASYVASVDYLASVSPTKTIKVQNI